MPVGIWNKFSCELANLRVLATVFFLLVPSKHRTGCKKIKKWGLMTTSVPNVVKGLAKPTKLMALYLNRWEKTQFIRNRWINDVWISLRLKRFTKAQLPCCFQRIIKLTISYDTIFAMAFKPYQHVYYCTNTINSEYYIRQIYTIDNLC